MVTKIKRKRPKQEIKIESGVPPPVVNNWGPIFEKMNIEDHFDFTTRKADKNVRSSLYLASRRHNIRLSINRITENTDPQPSQSILDQIKKEPEVRAYRVWRVA